MASRYDKFRKPLDANKLALRRKWYNARNEAEGQKTGVRALAWIGYTAAVTWAILSGPLALAFIPLFMVLSAGICALINAQFETTHGGEPPSI